jgi:hypothetical protein
LYGGVDVDDQRNEVLESVALGTDDHDGAVPSVFSQSSFS